MSVGECVICREDMFSNQQLGRVDCPGRHQYHVECINTWLQYKNTCPLDRRRVHIIDDHAVNENVNTVAKTVLQIALVVVATALAVFAVVKNIPVLAVPYFALYFYVLSSSGNMNFFPYWEN